MPPRVTPPAPRRSRQPKTATGARSVRAPRLRVLPITIMMAFLLFGLKSYETYLSGAAFLRMIDPAFAQEANEQEKKDPAETEKETASDDKSAMKEDSETATPEEKESITDEDAPKANDAADKQVSEMLDEKDENGMQREFSQIELGILQSLAERRDQLDERARALDLKEKLLEATELRINDKIDEAKRLSTEIQGLLKKYGDQEEKHLASLIKIYENMKPKAAANIFNELDMPILIEVIDGMSERKVSPILAAMDPIKAKDLTSDLAVMRKLKPVATP